MKHGNYQHGWLYHYCGELGFTINRRRHLWLNVRSKPCVKPSKEGGLYGVRKGARTTSGVNIWVVLKSGQVKIQVLCKFARLFILAL